jgi:hypothetical protein
MAVMIKSESTVWLAHFFFVPLQPISVSGVLADSICEYPGVSAIQTSLIALNFRGTCK